jgi:uncharacterized protein (DUF1697 family)
MRYVALLRGVNVGGNAIIRMAELRACAESLGLEGVRTHIASGNLLFRSAERRASRLDAELERVIEDSFGIRVPVVVRSSGEISRIASRLPAPWIGASHLRVTVAFLLRRANARSIAAGLKPRDGIDELTTAPGALIWATRRDALTRTGLRLVGTDAYRSMTLRNVTTALRLAELLRADP